MRRFVLPSTISTLILGWALNAFAEKMDLQTHTAVIDRLRLVVEQIDDKDVSKVPSALRLADLLAERSRLKNLVEVEQNCTNCLKSKEDRREAVKFYDLIMSQLEGESRSNSLLQKAHLHFSLSEIKKTEEIYLLITTEGSKKHESKYLGQAYASLGDVYFQKSEFEKAKKSYETALAIHETPQKGLVHYRLSWCLFNMNQVSKAIAKLEMVLQTPKMTELVTDSGVVQDESFKIDVAKDLASFYARTRITSETTRKLLQLSPDSQKQLNLYNLATEADRLGKKKEAASVWMLYLANTTQSKDSLEPKIRLMKLQRDLGHLSSSLMTFQEVKTLWIDPGCKEKCSEFQSQIRRWIIDWNREEKKNQSVQLAQAYDVYSQIFPSDAEMLFLGATAAQQRKQYSLALQFYRKSAIVHHQLLAKDSLEASLIGEMDMAETLKNPNLRLSSYQHYLELLPQGDKSTEVKFQIAHLLYEQKEYDKSAAAFRDLALSKSKDKDILEKSARLSIESLILAKNEILVEKWSLEFSQKFSKAKNHFLTLHRKAVMNNTAIRINQKVATYEDLQRLKSVSLQEATDQEKINLYKNIYLLSVQLKNFKEARFANLSLLNQKSLSAKDQQEAEINRIWLAELELDYVEAYELTQKLPGRVNEERALKLIWLAEMSNRSPEKHENDFLKLSHNRALRATVIAHRVQRQGPTLKVLKKHIQELSQSPDILSKLALEIFIKTGKRDVLDEAFKFSSVRKSSNAGLIARLREYPNLKKEVQTIAGSRLSTSTQDKLKKSLQDRLALLAGFDKKLNIARSNKDLILQAITANVLKYENLRLYNDLLKIPAPRGLTAEELKQYQTLLAQQANPYKLKSEKINEGLEKLWSDTTWTDQLAKNYEEARYEYKPALKEDILQLIRHAPEKHAKRFTELVNKPIQIPSKKAISLAQKQVRTEPFEISPVENLKKLESLRGNDIFAAHLEARIGQMKGLLK